MANLTIILYVIGGTIILASCALIQTKNTVYSVLFLIIAFVNSTALFIILGLDFYALIFLVVYVGAIAILFLFVMMMIQLRKVENTEFSYFLSIITGLIFFFIFLKGFSEFGPRKELEVIIRGGIQDISLKNVEWSNILPSTNLENIGQTLYNSVDSFSFIMAAIILMISMFGAILLTRRNS